MRSLKVWIAISAIIVAIVIVSITNLDELVYPEVENVASQVEFDDSTLRMITNTYAVNTVCEYVLLSNEIGVSPLADHTEWFEQKFGDIKQKVTDEFYNNMASDGEFTIEENEHLDKLIEEYLVKIKSRINPSILADYEYGIMPRLFPEHLEEDPSCAAIVQEYYPNLIP